VRGLNPCADISLKYLTKKGKEQLDQTFKNVPCFKRFIVVFFNFHKNHIRLKKDQSPLGSHDRSSRHRWRLRY